MKILQLAFLFVLTFQVCAQSSIQSFYDSVPGLEAETEKRFSAEVKPIRILHLVGASKYNMNDEGVFFNQDGFAYVYAKNSDTRVYMHRTRRIKKWDTDNPKYDDDIDAVIPFKYVVQEFLTVFCSGNYCSKYFRGDPPELSYTPAVHVEEEPVVEEEPPSFSLNVANLSLDQLEEVSQFLSNLGVLFVISEK